MRDPVLLATLVEGTHCRLFSASGRTRKRGPTGPSAQPIARTVVKAPAQCNFAINPASLSLGPASQAVEVALVAGAGCPWNAQSDVPWLALSPASGTDDVTLTLTPQSNTATEPRTGSVVVAGKTLLVVQAGTIPPNSCESLRAGGEGATDSRRLRAHSACAVSWRDKVLSLSPL